MIKRKQIELFVKNTCAALLIKVLCNGNECISFAHAYTIFLAGYMCDVKLEHKTVTAKQRTQGNLCPLCGPWRPLRSSF